MRASSAAAAAPGGTSRPLQTLPPPWRTRRPANHLHELAMRDLPVAVLVKVLEGLLEVLLALQLAHVDGGRQELLVVNGAVAVDVRLLRATHTRNATRATTRSDAILGRSEHDFGRPRRRARHRPATQPRALSGDGRRLTSMMRLMSLSPTCCPFFLSAAVNSSTVMVPLLSLSISRKSSRMPLISSTGRLTAMICGGSTGGATHTERSLRTRRPASSASPSTLRARHK